MHSFICARDDGSIEIYAYEHKSPYPILRFECKIPESITGLDVGFITTPGKMEVLISTYSGKILSLVDKTGKQITNIKDIKAPAIVDGKITKTELESQIENDIKKLDQLIE